MVTWTSSSNFTTTATSATRTSSGSPSYSAYAQTDPQTSGTVWIQGKLSEYGYDKNSIIGLGTQSGGVASPNTPDPFFCLYQTGSAGNLWAININGVNEENDQSMSDGDVFKLEYNFSTGAFNLYQNGIVVTARTGYSQTSLSGVIGGKVTDAGAYDITMSGDSPPPSGDTLLNPPGVAYI